MFTVCECFYFGSKFWQIKYQTKINHSMDAKWTAAQNNFVSLVACLVVSVFSLSLSLSRFNFGSCICYVLKSFPWRSFFGAYILWRLSKPILLLINKIVHHGTDMDWLRANSSICWNRTNPFGWQILQGHRFAVSTCDSNRVTEETCFCLFACLYLYVCMRVFKCVFLALFSNSQVNCL